MVVVGIWAQDDVSELELQHLETESRALDEMKQGLQARSHHQDTPEEIQAKENIIEKLFSYPCGNFTSHDLEDLITDVMDDHFILLKETKINALLDMNCTTATLTTDDIVELVDTLLDEDP